MARLINNIYTQGLTAQQRALALSPGILQSLSLPASTRFNVGSQRQAQQQQQFDLPFLGLSRLQQLLSGAPGGSRTTTIPGPRPPSTFNTALGGAALGASIGNIFKDTPGGDGTGEEPLKDERFPFGRPTVRPQPVFTYR